MNVKQSFSNYSFDNEAKSGSIVNSGDFKKIKNALNALIPSDCYISTTQY